tara:strand:- start:804 stop:2084 length:1281 start_codon:yes stop_codon:yes gene_type:complete
MYLDKGASNVFEEFKGESSIRNVVRKFPKSEELIEKLISENMIVKKDINEAELIKNWVEKYNDHKGLSIMYLLPTDECNFHCKYCFLENSFDKNYKHSQMDKNTLRKGIDFFVNNSKRGKGKRTIIIYGGEPLINKEIVREAINYTRRKEPDIGINVVTNGSLITDDMANLFANKNIFVGVSLDGPREITNKMRVFHKGNGIFNSAKRGYEKLKKAGCEHIGISFTIASHNIDNLKEHVEDLIEEFSPKAFGFNFLVDTFSGKNPHSVSIDYATDKVIEVFKFLREEGIFEERMMRKIKPFIKETIHIKDCGAPGNQIVLSPNGDIGPCQAFLPSRKYFTQNIHNKDVNLQKDPSFKEWSKRYPLNIEECLDCEAIGICGGGCPYNSYINKGSIWELDERMCIHNKKFLKWLLEDLYSSHIKDEKS